MLVKQIPRILRRTKAFSLKSVVTNKFHTISMVPEYGGGKAVTKCQKAKISRISNLPIC